MSIEARSRFVEHNWSRWGEADERGALNLLTPARVIAAAGLVEQGRAFSLGRPLGLETAVPPARPRPQLTMTRHGGTPPLGRRRVAEFADDDLRVATHTGSHIDAPAHVWYSGQLYNGFPSRSVEPSGATRCGVEQLGPLVGRGVLVDAAADGPLADGAAITVDAIERCLQRQGTELAPGDVILIRTGWWGSRAGQADNDWRSEPGPDIDAGCWLAERDPAAVGADNVAFEVLPAAGDRVFPVHELLLRDCGVPIMEGLDLDGLASSQIYEFLFIGAPLAIVGATASPLSPVAVT
jgi:kynurenine formamidase